jgi:glyoxylase-like metal-dependent hydrolase (beta-lactamase superfamily II)
MDIKPGKHIIDRINDAIMRRVVLRPMDTAQITGEIAAVRTDTANFFVFRRDGYVVCFDTGYRRRLILRELNKLGIRPSDVTHVFLTHADIDHVLGLRLFRHADVYLSHAEGMYVSGAPLSPARRPHAEAPQALPAASGRRRRRRRGLR